MKVVLALHLVASPWAFVPEPNILFSSLELPVDKTGNVGILVKTDQKEA